MYDLSVIIPARNEEYLSRTVEDVLAHTSDRTEAIVVLDGEWADPPLTQHPRVTVIHHHEAIGQRAATNLGASISDSRYICKVDAHVAIAPRWDSVLLKAAEELGPTTVLIPAQKNLHVFDYICESCGERFDQSPVRTACGKCKGESLRREVIWQPRESPTSSAWRFDSELHFQYWNGARAKQKGIAYPEIMSCLGACWFIDRQTFWKLGGLDTEHGSWGQMGTELACKIWLSGGSMHVVKQTWFAHFFRVGGHKFPYPIKGSDQEYAQRYSQNLWRGNHWPGQVKPLRWLVDKFWPVPGWTEEQREALPRAIERSDREGIRGDRLSLPARSGSDAGGRCDHVGGSEASTGIVYYSDFRVDHRLLDACQRQLIRAANGLPIVTVTLTHRTPNWLGNNLCFDWERGYLTMFRQILAGLESLDTKYAFLAEHDLLYHPSHFDFRPPNDTTYFYNLNWVKVDSQTGRAISYRSKQTSQLCANRQLLVTHYRERIRRVEAEGFSRAMGFEPGSHHRKERVDDVPSDVWRSEFSNLDIRHGKNLTPSRWTPDAFRDKRNCEDWQEYQTIPGWGTTLGCFDCFLNTLQRQDRAVAV